MKTLHRVAAAAFVASCLFTANVAGADERETFTVRVSHAGLDLRTAAGRASFDARVRRVARWACAPRGASIAYQRDAERCTAELTADAGRQLARRFGDDATRLASLTH